MQRAHKTEAVLRLSAPLDSSTLIFFAGQIAKAEAAVAAARKDLSSVRRRAKKAGIDLDVFGDVLKVQAKDPKAVIARWDKFKGYAVALEMAIGRQLSLFEPPVLPTPKQRSEQARRLGYVRGLEERDPDTAYIAVGLGREHVLGWEEGRRELVARMMELKQPKPQENGNDRTAGDAPQA